MSLRQRLQIASGENWFDIAREHGWNGGLWRNWVAANPAREAEFLAALRHRAEAAAEMKRSKARAAKGANDALAGIVGHHGAS